MRFSNPGIAKDETNSQIINMLIDKLVTDVHSHKFSMLYNGHTESSFGDRFTAYKDHVHEIHADSGGLQIVTQGMTITDELKDKVYENQAEWADVGMCFDEIPVILWHQRGALRNPGEFFATYFAGIYYCFCFFQCYSG